MEHAGNLRKWVERNIPAQLRSTISPEDILQEVFLRAFRNRAAFTPAGPDSLSRWMMKIAKGTVFTTTRNAMRAKRGGRHRLGQPVDARSSYCALIDLLGKDQPTPSAVAVTDESIVELQVAIAALPAKLQAAVVFRHLNGHSLAETAKRMSTTESAVNGLLYRGRAKLRSVLVQP